MYLRILFDARDLRRSLSKSRNVREANPELISRSFNPHPLSRWRLTLSWPQGTIWVLGGTVVMRFVTMTARVGWRGFVSGL